MAESDWRSRRSGPSRIDRDGCGPARSEELERHLRALGDEAEPTGGRSVDALIKIGEPAVDPLITALAIGTETVRRGAAAALGRLGDERAIEPLISALGSVDERVRCRAAEALGLIGDDRAFAPLLRAIVDESLAVRIYASAALSGMRAPEIEPMIQALGDEETAVRDQALADLAAMGAIAVRPLVAALADSVIRVHVGAHEALVRIGGPAVPPLTEALDVIVLDEANWRIGERIIAVLEEIGDSGAVEPLIKSLGHALGQIRLTAATALGAFADERAVKSLVGALGDGGMAVSAAASDALVRIGPLALWPLLIALGDEDSPARAQVRRTLRTMRDGESLVRWVLMSKEVPAARRLAGLEAMREARLFWQPVRALCKRFAVNENASVRAGAEAVLCALNESMLLRPAESDSAAYRDELLRAASGGGCVSRAEEMLRPATKD